MSWSRRDLLRAAGALGVASALPVLEACGDAGPDYVYDGPPADGERFLHGVASGDPLSDSVVLWTRVALGDAPEREVYVEVYDDPGLTRRRAAAWLVASVDRDGCVKVDLTGLRPGRTWYYRFRCQDRLSPVGRTRTAPRRGDRLRLALVSCSNYAAGWFHGYRALAGRDDLDVILHAGDYIYEYGGSYGTARPHDPDREIVSLDDYRTRYKQYRSDADLQEVHRQHPFLVTWDDHEVANNGWMDGAENHEPEQEGSWADREDAGRQAWFEWMPVREAAPGRLYRAVQWGDLAELVVLDTRLEGRERQTGDGDAVNDPGRQLLGASQEAWLIERLQSGAARWTLILNQVVMGQWVLDDAVPINNDQWDGYPAARRRILEAVREVGHGGVVVLTGDIHSSWAHDLPIRLGDYQAGGAGSVAVEAVTPAVTSPGADLGGVVELLAQNRPNIRFFETTLRGFVVLDVDDDRAVARWWHFADGDTEQPDYRPPTLARSLQVRFGTPTWVAFEGDLPTREASPPAP
jgi:alkaline phosphatase D